MLCFATTDYLKENARVIHVSNIKLVQRHNSSDKGRAKKTKINNSGLLNFTVKQYPLSCVNGSRTRRTRIRFICIVKKCAFDLTSKTRLQKRKKKKKPHRNYTNIYSTMSFPLHGIATTMTTFERFARNAHVSLTKAKQRVAVAFPTNRFRFRVFDRDDINASPCKNGIRRHRELAVKRRLKT